MPTISWLPDTPDSEGFINLQQLQQWDGENGDAVHSYLSTHTGSANWPAPTVAPGGVLQFTSFSDTSDGSPVTVPAYNFSIGSVILGSNEDGVGPVATATTLEWLKLNGTIKTIY